MFKRGMYVILFLICSIILSTHPVLSQNIIKGPVQDDELPRPSADSIFTKYDLLQFNYAKETKLARPHSRRFLYVQHSSPLMLEEKIISKYSYEGKTTLGSYLDSVLLRLNSEIVHIANVDEYEEKIQEYLTGENVLYVMPIYDEEYHWTDVGQYTTYPDDFDSTPTPVTGQDWWLEKLGMPYVWRNQECPTESIKCGGGESDVVIAVLDSGVGFENYSANFVFDSNSYEKDFGQSTNIDSNGLWSNLGESYGDIDYDGNGLCGDVHGADIPLWYDNNVYLDNQGWTGPRPCYDLSFEKEGRPNDDYGHGTAIANIIAGTTNDGISHPSVAHNAEMMFIKNNMPFGDPSSLYSAIGVMYAMLEGADIIQISSGSYSSLPLYAQVVQDALDQGIVVVAAIGNNTTQEPMYPAAYPGVIAVGSVNPDLSLSNYSNYGYTSFVAPVGQGDTEGNAMHINTLTCFPNCTYLSSNFGEYSDQYIVGTSFAAPQVSAAIALVKSRNPEQALSDLIDNLIVNAIDLGDEGLDVLFGYGLINVREMWSNVWSTWISNGRTPTVISMAELDTGGESRLFQAIRGDSGLIWTRYTIDGINWSEWVSNGRTPYQVSMKIFNPGDGARLYQAVRGDSGLIWTRYTTNGEDWSEWVSNGMTALPITMEIFNNRLYQVVKGMSGTLWTRYTPDGENWTEWEAGGATPHRVAMRVFYTNGLEDRLFQAIRTATNRLSVRYSIDGANWGDWNDIGVAYSDVTLASFNIDGTDSIFVATHDASGNVLTSFSTDGATWSDQYSAYGDSFLPVTMMQHAGKLYQVDVSSDTSIKTRYTYDGITWTDWFAYGRTPIEVTMVEFNGQLYQAVKGNSGLIWTRYIIK